MGQPHHRVWATVLSFLALPLQAPAAEIRSLTLKQAVELALLRNPTLRAQALTIISAKANEMTAALRPNPVFTSSSQDFTAGLSQLFERGAKRQRHIDSAKLSTDIVTIDHSDARRNLIFQVRKSFTDALLAKSNMVLAEENLKSFQEVEDLSTLRFQKGEISGTDILKIELQKLQLESDVQEAILRLRTAKTTLRTLLASPDLTEDFDVEGELSFAEVDMALADLRELAIRNRPDLHSAETQRKKAEADVRLAVANSYTDISLAIGYHHTEPSLPKWINPLFPQGPSEDSIGLGVSFPIRIFDRNQGEIARTRAEAIRVASLVEAIRNQIISEVEISYAAFRASRERARLYEHVYLAKGRELREIAEFAYNRGATSLLDLLEVNRTYRELQLAYSQVLASYLTGLHQLNSAVGLDLVK
jgi:cobalt-zinc-cadmium efflux system outer membrane protein